MLPTSIQWEVKSHCCIVCNKEIWLTADSHCFHIICGEVCRMVYDTNPLPYEVSGILFVMLSASPAAALRIQ